MKKKAPLWKRAIARVLNLPIARRSWEAIAPLLSSNTEWWGNGRSELTGLMRDLRQKREKSQTLEQRNRYIRGWLLSLESNIIGSKGFNLQSRVSDPTGKPDKLANDAIEDAWWDWGRKCTWSGESFHQTKVMVLRRVAVDGEILIRKRIEKAEKHPLRLELIEAERLDERYTGTTPEGNRVVMGVEVDERNLPIFYHILNWLPSDIYYRPAKERKRERVPADQIIHVFVKERPGQLRGVPWTACVMEALHNFQGYEDAEVIAARVASGKMGFFTDPEGAQFEGDGKDADGAAVMECSPGSFEDIGRKGFVGYDPQHPNQNYPEFGKMQLRGIGAGLGECYMVFANDSSDANYSSMRGSLSPVREGYMMKQEWFAAAFIAPVFEAWLELDLMAGAIVLPNGSPLPLRKLEKFNSPEWQGRRWGYVDPLKDIQATREALELKLTSHKEVLRDLGKDMEETFIDIDASEQLAELYHIDLPEEKDTTTTVEVPDPERP